MGIFSRGSPFPDLCFTLLSLREARHASEKNRAVNTQKRHRGAILFSTITVALGAHLAHPVSWLAQRAFMTAPPTKADLQTTTSTSYPHQLEGTTPCR